MDAGSLYQLRNLVDRRNVVSSPSDNVNANEDFFELVTTAHVLAAAMEVFGMKTLKDAPEPSLFPSDEMNTSDEFVAVLEASTRVILSQFTDFSYPPKPAKHSPDDHVQEYAKEVLTMGLFYLEYHDAIREGDGERVLRCWKFLLLFFKATRHPNYSIEAINLLSQFYYLLTPRMAKQLLWSRFVNSQGGRGHNIPADLHMEHLNRTCKDTLGNLGANKTPQAIVRAGKAAGNISKMLKHFDFVNKITPGSSAHTRQSQQKDIDKILHEIHTKQKVFAHVSGRKHSSFPTLACNIFRHIKEKKLNAWMQHQLRKNAVSSKVNRV